MSVTPVRYVVWDGTPLRRWRRLANLVLEEAKQRLTLWSIIIILITYLMVYVSLFFGAKEPRLLRPAVYYRVITSIFGLYLYMMLLSAYLASNIISKDISNRSIVLYLSRPLRRIEYVIAKFGAVMLHLATITLVPLVLVYLIDILSSPKKLSDIQDAVRLIWPILGASLLLMTLFASVALLLSSHVKSGKWSAAGMFGIFLIGPIITGIVSFLMENENVLAFSLLLDCNVIVAKMFDVDAGTTLSWHYALAAIAATIAVSIALLYYRIISKEWIE